MRKFMLSILMAILMVLSMGTVSAMAATNYDLWVGNTRVTSENAGNVLGDGKVSYDAKNNILTLNNATIYSDQDIDEAIRTYSSGDLTIHLIGNNTVAGLHNDAIEGGGANYGIYIRGKLTFTGDGTLNVSAASGNTSIAIIANGDINVGHDCKIFAHAATRAINPGYTRGNLVLNNAKVTASSNEDGSNPVVLYNNASNLRNYKYLSIEPAVTNTVTVTNGTGSGSYAEGTFVTITADAPATGMRFKEWSGADSLNFTNNTSKTSTTAKFTMPAQAVNVTATYEDIYAITVNNDGNGTACSSVVSAAKGTEITLTATPNSGYQFKEWQVVSGGVTITDNKFTMPAGAVEVKAIFEATTPTTPSIDFTAYKTADSIFDVAIPVMNVFDCRYSCDNGILECCNFNYAYCGEDSTGGTFRKSIDVCVPDVATNPSDYYYIFTVNGDKITQTLYKKNDSTFKHVMANDGVVLEYGERCFLIEVDNYFGTFVSLKDKSYHIHNDSNCNHSYSGEDCIPHGCGESFKVTYTVTVTNDGHGTGSASHASAVAGTEITLTVDPALGYVFDKWVVSGGVTISGNKFTMPAGDVTVKACFKEDTSGSNPGTSDPDVSVRPSGGTSAKLNYDATKKPEAPVAPTVVIPKGKLVLTIASTAVDVFGNSVTNDVAPEIVDGYTMLPGRIVVESLGGFIGWDAAEQRVRIIRGTTTIDFFIGQKFALVDGTPVEINVAPYIKDGRTFIEVRSLVEKLGAEIQWNGETKQVTIISK